MCTTRVLNVSVMSKCAATIIVLYVYSSSTYTISIQQKQNGIADITPSLGTNETNLSKNQTVIQNTFTYKIYT